VAKCFSAAFLRLMVAPMTMELSLTGLLGAGTDAACAKLALADDDEVEASAGLFSAPGSKPEGRSPSAGPMASVLLSASAGTGRSHTNSSWNQRARLSSQALLWRFPLWP